MDCIEAAIEPGQPITEHFIRELHSITVNDLEREGNGTPGAYRTGRRRLGTMRGPAPQRESSAALVSPILVG
jgi:Fic family protein